MMLGSAVVKSAIVIKLITSSKNIRIWAGLFGSRGRIIETWEIMCLRSELKYCCSFWSSSKIKDIQTLENAQKHFSMRVDGFNYLD